MKDQEELRQEFFSVVGKYDLNKIFYKEKSVAKECIDRLNEIFDKLDGFDFKSKDCLEYTPLISITTYGGQELFNLVAKILAKGADPDLTSKQGYTALHYAAECNYIDHVGLLLACRARTDLVNCLGWQPISHAVQSENLEIVKLLMPKTEDLNISDKSGDTPLSIAAGKTNTPENLEIIRTLIAHGANVNVRGYNQYDSYRTNTPLMIAAYYGNTVFMQELIRANADLNQNSKYSGTAAAVAAKKGHIDALKTLVEAGADLSICSKVSKCSPLHEAALKENNVECINFLLAHALDPNQKTNYGMTPVHYAARVGSQKNLSALIAAGGDIYQKNNGGKTPLDELNKKVSKEWLIAKFKAANPNMEDGSSLENTHKFKP